MRIRNEEEKKIKDIRGIIVKDDVKEEKKYRNKKRSQA